MCRYIYIVLFVASFVRSGLHAQSGRYTVEKAPFSTRTNDEFSPVFYNDGIVFCSNRPDNALVSYKNDQKRLYSIFYVTRKDSMVWRQPDLLAREITTDYNDGPATFDKNGNTIYYTRNNSVENLLKNVSDTLNKLGIYSAELVNGIWTGIKPFRYNNPLYSLCTPSITPDGKRIYFASDMPGGYGGMDLYYCDRINNDWNQPVNMGPVINTPKNESFPFASNYAKLFFASDGHKGFGGKDLYYTQEINGKWISPVHLDSSINSPADDFGIVTDSTLNSGYFSTNRRHTDDIFSFCTAPEEFLKCDTLKENNYCFTFYDEQHQLIDTIPVIYQWDFGDGKKHVGKEVKHCFPGAGEYSVMLTILDKLTGKAIAEKVKYKVELKNIEQAYINSADVGIVENPVAFDGLKTNIQNFRITDYLWNFGDGFHHGGPNMSQTFKKKGEYTIQLGLLGEKDNLGIIPKTCIMKKIRIYNNYQVLLPEGEKAEDEAKEENVTVVNLTKAVPAGIYFMDDLSERQKSKIKEGIKGYILLSIKFDKNKIVPVSFPVLDIVAGILKENPDIRLKILVHGVEDEKPDNLTMAEQRAQELAFYFRDKGIGKNVIHCTGLDSSQPVFKQPESGNNTIGDIIEFIFMKY